MATVGAMAKLVVNGAKLKCSQGMAPPTLAILPVGPASGGEQPAATVMNMQPMVNIAPFGMCQSQANPQVAAATAGCVYATSSVRRSWMPRRFTASSQPGTRSEQGLVAVAPPGIRSRRRLPDRVHPSRFCNGLDYSSVTSKSCPLVGEL